MKRLKTFICAGCGGSFKKLGPHQRFCKVYQHDLRHAQGIPDPAVPQKSPAEIIKRETENHAAGLQPTMKPRGLSSNIVSISHRVGEFIESNFSGGTIKYQIMEIHTNGTCLVKVVEVKFV